MAGTTKRVCGPLVSSKHPHAYDKKELIEKAVREHGVLEAKARSMTKEQLCKLLGLGYLGKKKASVAAAVAAPAVEKICSKKRSVSRYTKKDLEALAASRDLPRKDVAGKTYEELCKLLKLRVDDSIELPKTPTADKFRVGCVDRSKKPLKDYQKRVIEHMNRHRGLLVFHKVGSGKTLTAITVSQCYLDKHPNNRVIVITPAGLLNNFKDEMKKSYKRLNHVNRYEFYSFQSFVAASKRGEVDCSRCLLIIDEAHNLRTPFAGGAKKPKGINTKHITECAEKAHKVLLLTGTPLYNHVSDVRTLYDMIRAPGAQPLAGRSFSTQYVLDRLRCRISFYDPGKSDQFPKLIKGGPGGRSSVISIPMTTAYQTKYQQIVEDILSGGHSGLAASIFGEKNLEAFYNAIRRAVNNLDDTEANGKTTWVVRKITETPKTEKMIVFSNFLDAGIDLITRLLPKSVSYAVIRGDVPMKRRKQIVQDYNADKIQVLFISKAGGEGLDLKGTRHIIIMDPSWNQASIDQVIGRGVRYESHSHLPAAERTVRLYQLNHVLPEDVAPATIQEVNKYLRTFKNNPDIDPKAVGKIPLDPYANSIDFYLQILAKRKEILLDNFIKKMKPLSIEEASCS